MITGLKSRILMASLSGALFIGALMSPAAQAIESNVFRYTTPKNGSLNLGPGDFVPVNGGTIYLADEFSIITSGTGQCLLAGVHLPNAAVITQLRVFYKRPTGGDSLFVFLARVNSAGTSREFVANDDSTQPPISAGGAANFAADGFINVVNNALFRYVVKLCITDDAALSSARVGYTYQSAGD